jgi:hypothetical protein
MCSRPLSHEPPRAWWQLTGNDFNGFNVNGSLHLAVAGMKVRPWHEVIDVSGTNSSSGFQSGTSPWMELPLILVGLIWQSSMLAL